MGTDPEMRGTFGGPNGSAKLPLSRHPSVPATGDDIINVIERVVVKTCFKAAIPPDIKQAPPANPKEYGSMASNPRDASLKNFKALCANEVQPAAAGQAAMADVRRFIAVLDKVYSKVLTDGDFDFIGFMRARSLGPSQMLDLLEACAARLGEEWCCDSMGFVRVAVATSRLQRVLTALGQENRCFEPFSSDRSMLMIMPRGETHMFAVSLVEERFRLRGWDVSLVFADNISDLSHLLKASDFQVICIAWLDSELKNSVESVLHAIRTSVNRERTCIIAGGPAAEAHAQWMEQRGVEKVCSNAHIALNTAERHGATRNSAQATDEVNGSLLEPLRSA